MLKKQHILVKSYCIPKWHFQASHAGVYLKSVPSENVSLSQLKNKTGLPPYAGRYALTQEGLLINEFAV